MLSSKLVLELYPLGLCLKMAHSADEPLRNTLEVKEATSFAVLLTTQCQIEFSRSGRPGNEVTL